MKSWDGILFMSDGNSLKPCKDLIGKQFYCFSSDGKDKIIASSPGQSFIAESADVVHNYIEAPLDQEEDFQDDGKTLKKNSKLSFTQLSSGRGFTIGITQENELYSWGIEGDVGQLGQGVAHRKLLQPRKIKTKDILFTSISSGDSFSIALDKDGKAYSWGDNSFRQLALYTKKKEDMKASINCMIEDLIFTPRLVPFSIKEPLLKVSCGSNFVLAISKNKKLFSWGAGDCGQLGTGRRTYGELPEQVSISDNVKDITCGESHSLALTESNHLYGWGLNNKGQCGIFTEKSSIFEPQRVYYFNSHGNINDKLKFYESNPEKYIYYQKKKNESLFVKDLHLKFSQDPRELPPFLEGDEQFLSEENIPIFQKILAHGHSSGAIDENGKLWLWGSTTHGRLLHTSQLSLTSGEDSFSNNAVPFPTCYNNEESIGLRFNDLVFTKSKVGAVIKTTLTDVRKLSHLSLKLILF